MIMEFARSCCACMMACLPAPLSPRPWAMMTVAVCFAAAGMVRADILSIQIVSVCGNSRSSGIGEYGSLDALQDCQTIGREGW